MRLAPGAVVLLLLAFCGCGGTQQKPPTTPASTSTATGFVLTSPAFTDNTPIPAEYSCEGANVPPPLRWEHVPTGAASLALVVDDPDAPAGLYIHWVVTGMPSSSTEIGEGALPAGATVSRNSAGKAEYFGPCPPAGTGVHHYRFQLYALGKPLTVAPTTPAPQAAQAIADAAIGQARTVGLFG